MNKFHERLKELRMKNNFSKKELAKQLHISVSTVERLENNKSRVRLTTFLKVAIFFNVSCDYLCGRENKKFSRSN